MKYYILLALLALLPSVVSAETVVRAGEALTVDESQVVDGDYYVSVGPFGNTTMSGTVEGDMYALGGSVTTNGNVGQDLSILGGVAQLHASVTDDVRLLVGEATVAEDIGGDLFVLGGTLKVLSTAKIGGSIYFFGRDAVIDGEVDGAIHGTMDRLRVDGVVLGDVDVNAYENLTFGSEANIAGNVNYTSQNELVRAADSVIEGEISKVTLAPPTNQELVQGVLVPLLIIMFAALTMYLLFKKQLTSMYMIMEESYTKVALIGLGILVVGPMISILLLATILGLVVGVISLAAVTILLVAGFTLSGVMFGTILSRLMSNQVNINLLWIVLGVGGLYLIGLVPIVGPIVVLGMFIITTGTIALGLYRLLI